MQGDQEVKECTKGTGCKGSLKGKKSYLNMSQLRVKKTKRPEEVGRGGM